MVGLESHAEILWRALVYLTVVQLHLNDNVLLSRPLTESDIKPRPAGHWGTAPGVAWALVHIGLRAGATPSTKLVPMLGAGHAGVVQMGLSWLTGDLATRRAEFSRDEKGLTALARTFPDIPDIGSEVHPDLPAGDFLGGCLGGALAFACGSALDARDRVVVPIIGDGECETPTTAAAWLAAHELHAASVLPVVHLNEFRMGSRSILGRMSSDEVGRYFKGLGWDCQIVAVHSSAISIHRLFQDLLHQSIAEVLKGRRRCLVLRCAKGWSGPQIVNGVQHLGTAKLHKTPLTAARTSSIQRVQLEEWLSSYKPQSLFDVDGRPTHLLQAALDVLRLDRSAPRESAVELSSNTPRPVRQEKTFSEEVSSVLKHHANCGDFRLFSPDEMESNRLGALANLPWVSEVLAEEVLFGWLAGWISSGKRGLLVSYEAFSTLLTAGLISYLKQRRMTTTQLHSMNLLLTSYGWQNVYSHGDPSLVTTLLGFGDPVTHIHLPADPVRLGATLDRSLSSTGRLNVIIAGKHSHLTHPTTTIEAELSRGMAVWDHLSDPGDPDVTIICAGDLPAATVSAAVPLLHTEHVGNVRVLNVADLTVLGDPEVWPRGMRTDEWDTYVGSRASVLVVTLGHAAAVWGLLAGRVQQPIHVVGWREPPGPMSQAEIAAAASFDSLTISRRVVQLFQERGHTG
ncbi:hypothetical protein ACFYTQ_33360 [Nocardia sp. NPDC004068]|uniref:phosphoketolase family protein n=1 Tax=Nocardia sp. NPDC004068 TaxID=3364303 RepID=UPI0036CBCBC9